MSELKKYVDDRLGGESWNAVLLEAGLGGRLFLPVGEYADADAAAIVAAASRLTRQEPDAILRDFGAFIVPDLVSMYGSLLKTGWKTLDVIECTEETIHRVVRARNPGARPPELRCERPSADEVVIHYASVRKMCGVAKGIALGLARHYGEAISIGEPSCMLKGQEECVIRVRLRKA